MSKKKDWTKKYGDGHNARRQNRYQNDPEYREQVKKRSRESYHRTKTNGPTREKNGKQFDVVTRQGIADLAGITVGQVSAFIEGGYVPDCSFPGRWRVYTKRQASLVAKAFKAKSEGKPRAGIRANLDEQWEKEF